MDIQKRPVNPRGDGDLWWRPALLLFFNVSGWIGIPIIIAIFLGQWLDNKYGTEPKLFIVTVVAAFIISMIGLVTEVKKAAKKMEKETETGQKSNNNSQEQE